MPRSNNLLEYRSLDLKTLVARVKAAKTELNSLVIDKSLNKVKDTSVFAKKKQDLAQMLTVFRQKQLVEELEAKVGEKEMKKGENVK